MEILTIIYFIALFVLCLMIFNTTRKRIGTLQRGDYVFISGSYDRDKGWLREMRDYQFQSGRVLSVNTDMDDVVVLFSDGAQWSFSQEDITLCV